MFLFDSIQNAAGTTEHIEHTKLALNNYGSNPTVIQLANTKMNQVISKIKS